MKLSLLTLRALDTLASLAPITAAACLITVLL
jgi:hypothetical protein